MRLGEICKFQSGGTPSKSKQFYFNGTIPWITTVALNGGYISDTDAVDWITEKAISESAAKIVPKNSIMVGTRVGVGKVGINTVSMSTSQDVISLLEIDEEKWFKPYLCKVLQSKHGYLNAQARGATIKGIKIDVLASIDVPELSIDEQKKISFIIDKLTALISLRKQQLAKLDELVKARFVELFGDFIEHTTPVDFESICEFVTVGIANSATHAFCDDGIIMFRNQNIKEDYLDTSDIVHITPDFANKYKSKMLKKDDLLIVRTGYPGVACLVPEQYEGCQTFTTLIARIKHGNAINPRFVCHYINSEYGKNYVRDNSAGAAQQNFGATALSKLPICIPSIEVQDEYIRFVEQTDKSKSAIQQSLEKLETLKRALMQKYFG